MKKCKNCIHCKKHTNSMIQAYGGKFVYVCDLGHGKNGVIGHYDKVYNKERFRNHGIKNCHDFVEKTILTLLDRFQRICFQQNPLAVTPYPEFEEDKQMVKDALERLGYIDKISPCAINYDFKTLEKKLDALLIKTKENRQKPDSFKNEDENNKKRLKALDIIIEKHISIERLKCSYDLNHYRFLFFKLYPDIVQYALEKDIPTQKEYDLLKEVIK